jgi:hypothetical protein
MKTMKLGNEIIKVKNTAVDGYLSKGWSYCPRSEWKKNVRDINKKEEIVVEGEEKEKKNKGNPKGKAKKNKE